MLGFLLRAAITALALWVASQLLDGLQFSSTGKLALAAVLLGVVNAVVRPVMFILTLPITVLTLGLFYLVVNGLAFALAARLVPGFEVDSLFQSIPGAVLVSLISWFAGLSGRDRR